MTGELVSIVSLFCTNSLCDFYNCRWIFVYAYKYICTLVAVGNYHYIYERCENHHSHKPPILSKSQLQCVIEKYKIIYMNNKYIYVVNEWINITILFFSTEFFSYTYIETTYLKSVSPCLVLTALVYAPRNGWSSSA